MAEKAIYPSLRHRTVLVTGGGSGIGAAIVARLCEQGARVAFLDIDEGASQALVADLTARTQVTPAFFLCDLRDIDAIRRVIQEVERALGPIRVLVNNAAHDERHSIESVTPDYWDDRMAVNLRHQFFVTQAVIPAMAQAGGGSIINMGSTTWLVGQGGMPGYSAAKAAIAGLTRSLARDLGPRNIRVNSVLPGWTMTKRQLELWVTPEALAETMRRQCLKTQLLPEDIANFVVFLASDDSRMCTNQNYIVDGGWV
jgi:NAD(P)-dependent dehydrogenase (short-subunit alcohol dehydrogenase family)